jgi:hypothetical protein
MAQRGEHEREDDERESRRRGLGDGPTVSVAARRQRIGSGVAGQLTA